ncbi:MAG: PAS domain-containing methyl-accepting chemotaxis protein, partial [Alphaproteobacteria bacterium]|nr:PAS domain-containing methyl-accepting chemotaxis protein [Alphaproteobacteria bacterium]
MLFGRASTACTALLDAIKQSQAIIEFALDGTILDANENFLKVMGYSLNEVVGHKHAMFVDPAYAESQDYLDFWAALRRGENQTAEFRRIAKNGADVWLQASYVAVLDPSGKPMRVAKVATDITEHKLRNADYEGQVAAIRHSQAVIEFDMNGTILTANDKFLDAMGYSLDEIKGKHHSIFVDEDDKASAEYANFWKSLRHGDYQAAEYRRLGKGGREVWIQASYNPILDMNGKPFKVVKFATDVTARRLRNANYEGQIEAIRKAQAIVEFDMDGVILDANQKFLDLMGYRLDEVKGGHHSMFIDPDYRKSDEYSVFCKALRRGQYQSSEYRRLGKGGREVWIQASYNPILDMNGKPFKVVEFAADVTEQARDRARREKIQVEINDDLKFVVDQVMSVTQQATSASGAASQTSSNVQAVAAGAEELATSVEEISRQVSHALDQSREAVTRAGETSATISSLDETATKIGSVLALITDIAEQTNLLALNATI